jgi:HEPN domain-containing protein
MNPLTLEWIEKAEGDFRTMRRELHARSAPNYDAVCFHAQQCAEKYLKAFLHEHGQVVPRTHSLLELLAILLKLEPTFQLIQVDLNVLEGAAVQYRYPGQTA